MVGLEIQKNADFLLSLAISKCDSFADAEDLVQETVLAAISYEANGNVIENTEAFLRTIFHRKFSDWLRRKYQRPEVTLSPEQETVSDEDFVNELVRKEEAENVRREVAYLSEAYRTAIVRHYFNGKSVSEISRELGIPEGTVKSRLNFGRQQLKKGISDMKNYVENSYQPQRLFVCNSGSCGMNGEPMSLAEDPLSQNLLILAYEKPVTITELSKAIGVPSAYVEPIVDKLADGELMRRMGDGKVYTDFILYRADDYVKYIREQEAFADRYAEAYCSAVKEAAAALKQTDFYSLRLERYLLISAAEAGLWKAMKDRRAPQIFPERPNGGRWIAFGTIYPQSYAIPKEKCGKEEYAMSGQRCTCLEHFLDGSGLRLYNYETSLYPYPKYDGMGYSLFQEAEDDLLKLCYLIRHRVAPESVDCNPKILRAVPLLEERGWLTTKGGSPELLIPCLSHSQERVFGKLCEAAADAFAAQIAEPLAAYVKTHRKAIPAHLKSVPEQKLSMPYEPSAMMFVYAAIERGLHPRELGFPCPEAFVVME